MFYYELSSYNHIFFITIKELAEKTSIPPITKLNTFNFIAVFKNFVAF